MLVTGSERRDIPHEPGEWMELKRLNAKKLQKARDAQTSSSMDTMQATMAKEGGAEFVAALQKAAAASQEARAKSSDPLADFHRWKLCEYGIKSWSYDAEVTVANIEEFDETTLNWACREILILSGVDADPVAASKNGFEPSTVGSVV